MGNVIDGSPCDGARGRGCSPPGRALGRPAQTVWQMRTPEADPPPGPDRDPAAEAARLAGLAALAALLRAGLTEAQLSRLADLRLRARRGAFAADGYAGPAAPAPRRRPAP